MKGKPILNVFSVLLLICNTVFIGYYSGHKNRNHLPWISNENNSSSCGKEARNKTGVADKMDESVENDKRFLPDQLSKDLPVPRIVHQIIWTETLFFRNYLSILSVWKILRPYQIMLHVRKRCKTKEYDYNDWFDKAKSRIPTLQVVKLAFFDETKRVDELAVVRLVLKETGGIYVNINTIISSDLWLQFNSTLHAGLGTDSSIGFIAVAQNSKLLNDLTERSMKKLSNKCVSMKLFSSSDICCTVSENIFPSDIMQTKSGLFGSLARTLFYGEPDIPHPKTSFPPIPKLVHYVWFGHHDIDYSMFLSFLSTQRFVKPYKIFVYVDTFNVSRPYFDKMVAYSNVQIIYYGPVPTVFQNPLKKVLHVSDIIRADVLLRFGGIYLDWDTYWLKSADDILSRGYETIASLDFFKDMYPRQGFPDTINMGVLLARPKSRFLALWQESFKHYTGQHHTYHAVEYVYKLYEEHPDLLVIDRRLQVMCHYLRCHPLWLNNYKNDKIHNDFNFTKDAYTVHFTDPIPHQFSSEENIKNAKGFIGDLGRHILGTNSK